MYPNLTCVGYHLTFVCWAVSRGQLNSTFPRSFSILTFNILVFGLETKRIRDVAHKSRKLKTNSFQSIAFLWRGTEPTTFSHRDRCCNHCTKSQVEWEHNFSLVVICFQAEKWGPQSSNEYLQKCGPFSKIRSAFYPTALANRMYLRYYGISPNDVSPKSP
jgi:hypothetical protein